MVKDLQKNKVINSNIPFIGYFGYGSKIRLKENAKNFIIKDGWSNKIFLIGGMFLFGPYITYLIIFSEETKDNPLFITIILIFFSSIGWIFFIKFLYRFIFADRNIVINKFSQTISLNYGRKKILEISNRDIDSYSIAETTYRSKGNTYPNYTLELLLKNEDYIYLIINNDKITIEKLMHIIKFGSD